MIISSQKRNKTVQQDLHLIQANFITQRTEIEELEVIELWKLTEDPTNGRIEMIKLASMQI